MYNYVLYTLLYRFESPKCQSQNVGDYLKLYKTAVHDKRWSDSGKEEGTFSMFQWNEELLHRDARVVNPAHVNSK